MLRRDFIKASSATAVAPFSLLAGSLALPAWAQEAPAMADDFWLRPRSIRLRRDGLRLESTYWIDGEIQTAAWQEISWFLRDKVDNKAVWMEPVLMDILYGVDGWLRFFGISDPMDVTSGHRTHRRNLTIEGAAKDSEHVKGGATDIRHTSVPSQQFAKFGVWLGGGGVGWYPSKGFTHVDRGRLRFWRG
jgi:uncharacterized protein YcbK (DUF882 family)